MLLKKLQALATLKLVFNLVTPSRDQDGNHIAILTLVDPIPHVRGSQEVEVNGARYPINAEDVTEVKVHQRELELLDSNFKENPDGTITYEGDKAILDVSKQKQVWLTTTSFASAGNKMRQANRSERVAKLVGLTVAEATPAAGTAGKPEAVVTKPQAQGAKQGA